MFFLVYVPIHGQNDDEFIQKVKTFDHRMQHPTEEDFGFRVTPIEKLYSEQYLDYNYLEVINEKKDYIKSQIGKVSSDLIFQQVLASNFTEEEIYDIASQYQDEAVFLTPFGRQIKQIMNYVEEKEYAIGSDFPQLAMHDENDVIYSFPYLGSNRYILLHFWSTFCSSCKEKNQIFSEKHQEYNRSGVVVISVCVDYYPDHWKKMMSENEYNNPQYYIPRTDYMDLAEEFTLELSSTLLLTSNLVIKDRDIFKYEEVMEAIIFK